MTPKCSMPCTRFFSNSKPLKGAPAVRFALFAVALLLGAQAAAKAVAIDAIEPVELCERFLREDQKAKCLKDLKRSEPDSYLAAICDRQDQNQAMMECLKLSSEFEFDPRGLQNCGADSLSDEDRIGCLRRIGKAWKPAADRLPAQEKKKNQRLPRNQRISR